MFGYLQIQKSELLVRESEAYKAVYCGLCRQMGKDYSVFTRFTLSYDCTFYAMLLMSLNRSCKGFKDGRCTCNPLKKCKFATDSGDAYRKAAAFSMISVYYKIIDDIQDSGFFKKLLCRIIKPFFSHQRKKAADKYPDMDKAVSNMMKMQYDAEHSEKPSVDMSAHPTALMLAAVLSAEAHDEIQKRVLYEFGYHIGRWIYLVDAADDIFVSYCGARPVYGSEPHMSRYVHGSGRDDAQLNNRPQSWFPKIPGLSTVGQSPSVVHRYRCYPFLVREGNRYG